VNGAGQRGDVGVIKKSIPSAFFRARVCARVREE
jgi:hypothetical protein